MEVSLPVRVVPPSLEIPIAPPPLLDAVMTARFPTEAVPPDVVSMPAILPPFLFVAVKEASSPISTVPPSLVKMAYVLSSPLLSAVTESPSPATVFPWLPVLIPIASTCASATITTLRPRTVTPSSFVKTPVTYAALFFSSTPVMEETLICVKSPRFVMPPLFWVRTPVAI